LSHFPGGKIASANFRPQLPPELEFDWDRLFSANLRLNDPISPVDKRAPVKRTKAQSGFKTKENDHLKSSMVRSVKLLIA
jgi:hypothetical protein